MAREDKPMKVVDLNSKLGPSMQALIELRQSLGYCDKNLVSHLRNFDHYLVSTGQTELFLIRRAAEEWAAAGTPRSRCRRLQTLRILGRFLAQSFPECYIPGPAWGSRSASSFRPHIYTQAEIEALLIEAARLPPAGSLRPLTYVTLISLLYTSGLRISEALALRLCDVDLEDGILSIHESKFHKSRSVPLHATVTSRLRHYLQVRNQKGHRRDSEASFLVNEWKRNCNYGTVIGVFLGIARRAGLRGPPGQSGPRIHDLRHTFAVHRLLAWYRDDGDVQARLPLLATYLGHVCIVSTQVYLEITAELLDQAARRFQPPDAIITKETPR